MGSEQNRFGVGEQRGERGERKGWGGCFSDCFGGHKGKRIVPATRLPDASSAAPQPQPPQAAVPSLLAPPSSPASFTNSALPSTAQSPACFPSPGGPSSTMFATGPYAHETQLVSPPVFSTFTTEPSTAPLTPPPELAHLTTPSSPDVPFARFLTNSNFFCPETFAQFYLENPNGGGRLSVSKDSDVVVYSGQVQHRSPKQEADEIEAYRASFGFSADEMVTTAQYVEISDVAAESSMSMSMTMTPPPLLKPLKTPQPPPASQQDDKRYLSDEEDIFAKMASSGSRKYHISSSDAEIDYRRGRSLRHTK